MWDSSILPTSNQRLAETIITEREQHGEYSSLEDFICRVPAGIEQLVILIRLDAFRFTGKTKKQLLWEAHLLLGKSTRENDMPMLFSEKPREFTLPQLEQTLLEDAYDEIELLGFPVTLSNFDMLETGFRGDIPACAMEHPMPDSLQHMRWSVS